MQTPYSSEYRKALLYWIGRAPHEIVCRIMNSINPSPWKQNHTPEEARLYALLESIEAVRKRTTLTERKSGSHKLSLLHDAHTLRVQLATTPRGRNARKRDAVRLRANVIVQLRQQGVSWRQIAVYLKKCGGLTISHSYLRECCMLLRLDEQHTLKTGGTHG